MDLIDPKIQKGYEKIPTTNGSQEKKVIWFGFRLGVDAKGIENASKPLYEVKAENMGQSSIHRVAFLNELVALVLKEMVTFGKRVVVVDEQGEDGKDVRLTFADGDHAEASAVLGCDGVNSNLCQILLWYGNLASHATFTYKHAYRTHAQFRCDLGL